MNHVAFPGLNLDFELSRVAFSIFGKPIYWYAIIIIFGFFLATAYGIRRGKQIGLKEDNILDMLICAVPAAIVGARLYYVIFNFDLYRGNLIKVFYIWEGGIAIYGGIIGAIIAAGIYCRVKRVRFSAMLDIGALGLLIGQCIGRWGNFVNGEAYGVECALPWRMEIFDAAAAARIAVHPTFLYESLWNLLGFLLLHFRLKKRKFSGEVFLWYVVWYGFGRGLIEGLRTDSLYFLGTGLRVSQFLGFASCLAAAIVLFYFYLFRDPELLEESLVIPDECEAEKDKDKSEVEENNKTEDEEDGSNN